jgi:hypothetical protein
LLDSPANLVESRLLFLGHGKELLPRLLAVCTWGFLKKAKSTAAQWIQALSDAKMCSNGLI